MSGRDVPALRRELAYSAAYRTIRQLVSGGSIAGLTPDVVVDRIVCLTSLRDAVAEATPAQCSEQLCDMARECIPVPLEGGRHLDEGEAGPPPELRKAVEVATECEAYKRALIAVDEVLVGRDADSPNVAIGQITKIVDDALMRGGS